MGYRRNRIKRKKKSRRKHIGFRIRLALAQSAWTLVSQPAEKGLTP